MSLKQNNKLDNKISKDKLYIYVDLGPRFRDRAPPLDGISYSILCLER